MILNIWNLTLIIDGLLNTLAKIRERKTIDLYSLFMAIEFSKLSLDVDSLLVTLAIGMFIAVLHVEKYLFTMSKQENKFRI